MYFLLPFLILFPIILGVGWHFIHKFRNEQRKKREQSHSHRVSGKDKHGDGALVNQTEDETDDVLGDEIQLLAEYDRPDANLPKKTFRLDIEFEDLGLKIQKGNEKVFILQGVTGRLKSGRVTGT